ncbi:MAG: hypothetical protein HCA25_24740 [Dolichospermum sp. DET50]|nr:hypothetical protein [Dolichospermum sp. DET66]MBS3035356.1 hypothetical protein [Dolichospermum sp. DET67]MBS3040558.1 hypothetical protein [Dolichospermum sp. DET50]QSX67693.1 MAG: hypothetical protein EZY12_24010 [Dolichospermum sp. DET69]
MFLTSIHFLSEFQEEIKSRLLGVLRKIIPLSVNYEYEGLILRIVNHSEILSKSDLIELGNFITQELDLFSIEEFSLLESIIIDTKKDLNVEGFWRAKFSKNKNNPKETTGVYAWIFLNAAYLTTLKDFKTTLAHEYGHHWTILYFIKNHGFQLEQRLSDQYYQLRGLNNKDYAPDYTKGWLRCDREIIAEDYRVISAYSPHNQEHRMASDSGIELTFPNEEIKLYIKGLKQQQ